ncbi:MAG: YncE family protein [Roseiflexaceae bacterium]
MGKRIVLGMLAMVALLVSGCGAPDRPAQSGAPAAVVPTAQPPQPPQLTPVPGDELYVRDSEGSAAERLMILSSTGGTSARELPLGAVAPDRSTLYTVESSPAGDGFKTRVRALDPKTGVQVRETTIEGAYILPTVSVDGMPGGLSPNGHWLVLRKVPGQTIGRSQSQFVVLDTAFAQPPRRVDLDIDGLYDFDGISNSGNGLYLIQYQSSPSLSLATPYLVRYYDMAQKLLDPQPIVAKGEDQVMAGTHHTSVPAPNGVWRYSLYMNNTYGPFIHALNLNDRFAICVDLPKEHMDDAGRQMFWSLAVSPNGKKLYAANGALGLITEINISQDGLPEVQRSVTLPPAPSAGAGSLDGLAALFAPPVAEAKPEHGDGIGGSVLSPDGKTLFAIGERGLLAIGTADLKEYRRYLPDVALSSVALSADGKRLYTTDAGQGRIVVLDLATGAPLAEITGVRSPGSILWVESQNT